MAARTPVNDSIREIDDATWVLGGSLILSRSLSQPSDYCWYDEESTYYYRLDKTAQAPHTSRPLSTAASSPIRLVHDAGAASAVWEVGNAFIKVKLSEVPDATREHITLEKVKAMSPSFKIPEVLYHGEWEDRYYLITSKVPGRTLADAWRSMDEDTKCGHANYIVKVCDELAEHKGDFISGLDGRHCPDSLLVKHKGAKDFSPENLRKNCEELGMDCTDLVFYHCDLGPGNLIICSDGQYGIIDWETAAYVPRQWIRTRFCIADGLNLPGTDDDERFDWRRRVQKQLSIKGYEEIADTWMDWWTSE